MQSNVLVANPHVDAVFTRHSDGTAGHVEVCAFTTSRGFTKVRIGENDGPTLNAVDRILGGIPLSSQDLPPLTAKTLWSCGLMVAPNEIAAPLLRPDVIIDRSDYARDGFMVIPPCVTGQAVNAMVAHYRRKIAATVLPRRDAQADRYYAKNDPAGRVMQRALRSMVQDIVGRPIKPSYTYASLYCGGTRLPKHTDRPQCRYTISLQILHRPLPADGCSPWPVEVYLDDDATPALCFQAIGGAILFRGHEISHARPSLTEEAESWVVLLHFVDADFEGDLN